MKDVLIVGAGVIGQCVARELVTRGCSVTLLDAADAVPPASWAGGGILSPLFPWRAPPPVSMLTRDAMARYRTLIEAVEAAGAPIPELNPCGLLVACPDDADQAHSWARDWHMRVQAVAAGDVQSGLTFERGLYWPDLGAIRNPGLLAGLARLLDSHGVERRHARVEDIHHADGYWRVNTETGVHEAAQLVVAAGRASPPLLRPLGLELPVYPVKGEMLMYRGRPGQLSTVVLTESGYLIPRLDGRILAGSTLEPGVDSVVPSREAGERLHARALALMPALRGCPLEAQWAGVRPGIEGEVPLIGAVPDQEGLWLATGHYRNGLVSAPATAELLAQQMLGERPRLDPAPFAPARLIRRL